MEFRLDGNKAASTGDSDYFTGLVTGNVMEGAWIRTSEFGQGIGEFKIILSKDGRRFTGKWERWLGVGSIESELVGECIGANRN